MGSRSLLFRSLAQCVAVTGVILLTACGHDDGGQPVGPVRAAQWARTYGGASADVANSVQPTSDGGYIVAGSTRSFGPGDRDAWVLKLDANGNVLWQKTYGGPGDEFANSVRRSADGGYVVTGGARASPDVPDSANAWVMKIDGNGNVIWQKTFGSPGPDEARSVEPTADGGYVVAGTWNYDVWVLRLDAAGNVLWQRTYGGTGGDNALAAQPTSDGGYIVVGDTTSYESKGSTSPWVLKLDSYGNVVWQKLYVVADPSNGARSVQQTADGGYIVAGYTNAWRLLGNFSQGDVWLLKLDAAGNVVWQRKYGLHMQEEAYSVQLTPDGGYVVAGFTEISEYSALYRRALLLKLDTAGSVVWTKTFGGDKASDEARFVQVTADGGYIVAGLTGAFRAEDAWVLKLDANGAINGCAITAGEVAVGADTIATTASSTATAVDTNETPTSGKFNPTDSTGTVLEQCRYE